MPLTDQAVPRDDGNDYAGRTITADICDKYPDAHVIPRPFLSYGAKNYCVGPVELIATQDDNTLVAKTLKEEAGNGRVLIVENMGSMNCAMVGGNLGRAAFENGWNGIIVNGAIRDGLELQEVPIGIFALASCPRASRKRGIGKIGDRLRFVDAYVQPNDYAAADQDGVVFIPGRSYNGV